MAKIFGKGIIFLNHLIQCRANLGLSHLEVAKRLGYHPSHLEEIENGEEIPSYDLLAKLAAVYGENPLAYLICRTQQKEEYERHHLLKTVQDLPEKSAIVNSHPTMPEPGTDNPGD